MICRTGLAVVVALALTRTGEAGQSAVSQAAAPVPSEAEVPLSFDGPPAPVAPEVISRDESGRATIRAVRVAAPPQIDGRLDETVYETVRFMSGFIQVEPQAGVPATQQTDVWLLFDDQNVYVSVRCWEREPDRMIANEMRRDGSNMMQNESIAFTFDTSYDRRNAMLFMINPIGGRMDGQVTNERQYNGDLNPIWEVATGRFDGGWTVEAAVPFKSLRYRGGRSQVWGFNIRRINRWKNELSFLLPMPPARGNMGIAQISQSATVVGLEAPAGSKKLEIKPYVTSHLTSDVAGTPRISNDVGGDVGGEVKYGVSENLTADFTYNTDFAQVEADEQQVNLTRFSLFFPEKREFFLENQGTFAFGGVGGLTASSAGDTPTLFYSRSIGLSQGRAVPIDVGGRLTGRVGRFSVGALNIQTGETPEVRTRATNFSVVRIKRDVLRRSSVGVLMTRRSVSQRGLGANETYGVDGTFAFFQNLALNTYWARTHTEGLSGDDTSYRAQLDYDGDRYGVQLERLLVGEHFNPEVGFVPRLDMRRSFGLLRFSPRPKASEVVRKLFWTGSLAYIENAAGRLETRDGDAEFAIDFQSSDRLSVGYSNTYEFLTRPFPIAPGVAIPVGGYDFAAARIGFTLGQQRALSAVLLAEHGSFYSGHRTTFSASRGRVMISPQLSMEPSYSVNVVDLAEGSFTTHLAGSRVTYTMTPLMFVSALLQYNTSINAVTTNVRLRWEYQPGSELFVVYNEQRDTLARRFPDLANRALIFKINRLFRF